jgi:phosphoribosylaminoimidazolecarboxamide formyltransferase/IMP cyclohydrolase
MRAILSVFDKAGVVEFADGLAKLGCEVVSTGGTQAAIEAAGVPVTGISDVTGFPEILDGRVKTLHPVVHAGILARQDDPEHVQTLHDHGIAAIGVVAVNLYPFVETLNSGADNEEIVENIDIGGPTLIRAAAKNADSVLVVVDPSDYAPVLDALANGRADTAFRARLAAKAFQHTADYDTHIAAYFKDIT